MATENKPLFEVKTYGSLEKLHLKRKVILPRQVHGTKVVNLNSGGEDLSSTDGMITENPQLILGIATADCAPVAFWEKNGRRWGIAHLGWRGLVAGLGQKMLSNFQAPQIFIGPFLERFEIQKDQCYLQIKKVFGESFFQVKEEDKIYFDFKSALASVFQEEGRISWDGRNTFDSSGLASWRRDKDSSGRNITIIRRVIG